MSMLDRQAAVVLATLLVAAPVGAAGPYPPYSAYPAPPPQSAYQSSYPSEYQYPYPPPPQRVIDPNPPPLSPMMRAIYAPFYVTGLVLRYGIYYTLVAPFEVMNRAITYGVEGGVERRPPPPPQALAPVLEPSP